MPRQYLLIVTEDGYGKRVAVDEIPQTKRRSNASGRRISRELVAAALVVDNDEAEIVIATAGGKIERLRVGDVPTRRRRWMSRGVPVIRLTEGDLVASVALVASDAFLGVSAGLRPGEEAVA